MFDIFRKKKRKAKFSTSQQLDRLAELSPPSTFVTLIKSNKDVENLGRAFFLRRDKKIYSDGENIYLTTPENLKIAKNQNLNSQVVSLQFFSRRVPHTMNCRVAGRYRLLPDVVETLDFKTKAAYKLSPISPLQKEDKRQYLRYTLKNYGDSRIPLTTHIAFDLYLKTTNETFPNEGSPPIILNSPQIITPEEMTQSQDFTTRDAINDFRELMLEQQPHERFVHASKVIKDDSGSMAKRPDEELLLGEINVLGLEMESLRDVLYFKKSAKSGMRKGKDNPYNLNPGEKLLTHFSFGGQHYKMLCEVMEARTQNEVVRPLEFKKPEPGIKTELVDYGTGGSLIESSPQILKILLGDKCPADVEEDTDFDGEYWQVAFENLKYPMVHLTYYPRLNFPDAVKQFQPELPFKISIIGQIVRTNIHTVKDRKILQLGIQFAYEPQGIPLKTDESVNWRYTRNLKDHPAFQEAHSHLSQLYGFLENQSLSSGTTTRRMLAKPKPNVTS